MRSVRYKISIVLVLILIGMTGCRGEDSVALEVDENEFTDDEPEYMEAEVMLTWIVPDGVTVEDAVLSEFNQLLADEGYEFGLKIERLDWDNYSEVLVDRLETGTQADIINVGFDRIMVIKLIDHGFLTSLDDYLGSGSGQELQKVFVEEYWEAVKCNDTIYTVPSGALINTPLQYVFNRSIVAEEMLTEFDGSIESLWELIQIYEFTPEEFRVKGMIDGTSLYAGLSTESLYGIMLSYEDQIANSPFEYEPFVSQLRALHAMYQAGYIDGKLAERIEVDEVEQGDFAVYINDDSFIESTADRLEIICAPVYISSRINGSNGVLVQSEYKEEAFQLLSLVHTDSRFANLLLYGREGKEYTVEDGIAVFGQTEDGGRISDFVNGLCFGIYERAWPSEEDYSYIKKDRELDKKKFYADYVEISPFIGFQFRTDGYEEDLMLIETTLSMQTIWQEEDFDEALNQMIARLSAMGIDEIVEAVNLQLEAFHEE